jgi:hypothetical protein
VSVAGTWTNESAATLPVLKRETVRDPVDGSACIGAVRFQRQLSLIEVADGRRTVHLAHGGGGRPLRRMLGVAENEVNEAESGELGGGEEGGEGGCQDGNTEKSYGDGGRSAPMLPLLPLLLLLLPASMRPNRPPRILSPRGNTSRSGCRDCRWRSDSSRSTARMRLRAPTRRRRFDNWPRSSAGCSMKYLWMAPALLMNDDRLERHCDRSAVPGGT